MADVVRIQPVIGGTRPADVARVQAALADILTPSASPGSAPQPRTSSPDPPPAGLTAPPEDTARRVVLPLAPNAHPATAREIVLARIPGGASGIPSRVDVILQTSGSTTGTGHLVGISAGALRASARATAARLAGHGQWLACLPAHHVAGVQVLVRSLLAGTPPVLLDTSEGFRPDAFAAAARRTHESADGRPTYVSLVPTQLVRLLADDAAVRTLSGFTAILVGGAAAGPDLLARARAAGARAVATYGMTETGGGCVYDGRPLDGIEVSVDERGRILIAGPVLAEGYLDDPVRTAASFRARGEDAQRVLVTADRGEFTTVGPPLLRVLGRVDDLIITGGIKVDPSPVAHLLGAQPGIAEVSVVGIPDAQWGHRVVAVVVLEESPGDAAGGPAGPARPTGPPRTTAVRAPAALRKQLREVVRAELGGAHAPQDVVLAPGLPQRGPGKIDRTTVAALAVAALAAAALGAPAP